tara:strand:- start:181 stop:447 length:267 start_codon:yes stop_codon:yes gene_type:complete
MQQQQIFLRSLVTQDSFLTSSAFYYSSLFYLVATVVLSSPISFLFWSTEFMGDSNSYFFISFDFFFCQHFLPLALAFSVISFYAFSLN